MRTTIDGAGRIVVPKKLRDRLGLVAGTEIEISETATGLAVEPAGGGALGRLVEDDGLLVIEGDGTHTFTVEDVRGMVSDIRDDR